MSQPTKPGYKTSEFWISVVCLCLGALLASGAIGDQSTWGKMLAFAASALTALGYNVSRGMVKRAEALSTIITESETDPK